MECRKMKTKEEVLNACVIDGLIVRLPAEQLDRKLYMEVAKSIELIGGKWKGGKVAGFVFQSDPTDLFEQICNGEKRNLKKEYQFFATPDNLADTLVQYAGIKEGDEVLEPSAGQGAIISAIKKRVKCNIYYCELMPINIDILNKKHSDITFSNADFLEYVVEYNKNFSGSKGVFDKIVANPPFTKNQDIDHVKAMFDVLKAGGRMVSMMSTHWQNCDNKKETEFRAWLDDKNASIVEVEAGAFKESGTNIKTVIVIIDKR
jgi:phospholipid N-methyltransferase